jgi:hypothetical protein
MSFTQPRLRLTSFEDQLTAQYRDIARRLPIGALLGETLEEAEQEAALPDFYHYFDLCNEQAFLSHRGRIRPQTWNEWREGIEQKLSRPAFEAAWREVSTRAADSFNDLRQLVPLAANVAAQCPAHARTAELPAV